MVFGSSSRAPPLLPQCVAPATETWVMFTGTWYPKGRRGSSAALALDAKRARQVEEPSGPYEKS
jgi:hypothetical protein